MNKIDLLGSAHGYVLLQVSGTGYFEDSPHVLVVRRVSFLLLAALGQDDSRLHLNLRF